MKERGTAILAKARLGGWCSLTEDRNAVNFKHLLWISRDDHVVNLSSASATTTSVL